MAGTFKTEQELFWAGTFGNDYINRNNNSLIIAANINLFSKILNKTSEIQSVIEFGSNIGLNLKAIKQLLPNAELCGIEINEQASAILKEHADKVYNQSILEFIMDYKRDLVLIKGVLIHINPDELENVYQKLYDTSKKYILIAEYYNPTPVVLPYRGHNEKLFKRDFAGEILDKFNDLELVDYGFSYHRDPNFPQDDINWFLLRKN